MTEFRYLNTQQPKSDEREISVLIANPLLKSGKVDELKLNRADAYRLVESIIKALARSE